MELAPPDERYLRTTSELLIVLVILSFACSLTTPIVPLFSRSYQVPECVPFAMQMAIDEQRSNIRPLPLLLPLPPPLPKATTTTTHHNFTPTGRRPLHTLCLCRFTMAIDMRPIKTRARRRCSSAARARRGSRRDRLQLASYVSQPLPLLLFFVVARICIAAATCCAWCRPTDRLSVREKEKERGELFTACKHSNKIRTLERSSKTGSCSSSEALV